MKYLLVLIVVVVVLALMFGRRRGGGASASRAPRGPEGMVRCAHCGIHLPRSEALLQGGRTYCCAGHLEQDRRES
jgi:uncharacterized protein